MTERIKKLNEVQAEALQALEKHNFRGTIGLCPGGGKTFTSFKALYRMLELGLIPHKATIPFLAETVTREKTVWEDEIPKFKTIYGKDILSDFNLVFHCYQGRPDKLYNNFEKVAAVIADEPQDAATAEYHPILTENKCKYVIGLTGAVSLEANVFPTRLEEGMVNRIAQSDIATSKKQVTDFVTKGQLFDMFLPFIYTYTTAQAIEDGVISRFKTFIINHTLDNTNKAIQTWKSYATLGTEQDYYVKRDNVRTDFRRPKYQKMRFAREMCSLLYRLPSKTNVVKAILKRLEGQKTLIFGVHKEALYKITDNVVESHNYQELIDKFNSGEINVIASAKMLKQGITLDGVQNIIFHSYDSKWHNMEQKRARVRWLDGNYAKLFFVVTQGTFEEKWFSKLKNQKDSTGNIVQVHDLNVASTINSSTLVNWYKNQLENENYNNNP